MKDDKYIKDLGEFGLIARIDQGLVRRDPDVIVGVGDDTAALRVSGERLLLATCDVQIEGEHFLRESAVPYLLGRKSMAINLSDIAAMGGLPKYALVSLGLPPDLSVEFVDELYRGFQEELSPFGAEVVGGNLSRSPVIMVDITLLGEVEPEQVMLRAGARVGDAVAVTGTLGDSAAGLALLDSEPEAKDDDAVQVIAAHRSPTPRVGEGQTIARAGIATAMDDLSDGLASDLSHIIESSHVGAVIRAEELPISGPTRRVAPRVGKRALDLALFGGEDYELLFTAPPARLDELRSAITKETGTSVTVVGEIVSPEEGMHLELEDGTRIPLLVGGWDHFRIGEE